MTASRILRRPDEIAFGRRVETIMRAKGLTPADVAGRLGASESSVRKLCSGYAVRQFLQLPVLAQALGVGPLELLGLEPASLDKTRVLNAVQAVIESLGFDRDVALSAAGIALEAAAGPRVLDEPDEAEVRAMAKLLMRRADGKQSVQ